ncbi:MAG: hypothetical protein HYY02_06520 [Chloroflexi bacterium]|nr:hypothetical protein [Chloroflexota bacterium]
MANIDDHLIRNVFDQYTQLENRLTNALFQVFRHEPDIAREFVVWAGGPPHQRELLQLACQMTPASNLSELEKEDFPRARTIPDGWIFDPEGEWAVVIENKVTATLERNQIEGHITTARALGFRAIFPVVLTADREEPPDLRQWAPAGVTVRWRPWRELYVELKPKDSSWWVKEFLGYMEELEFRFHEGGNSEVELTGFSGIPFDKEHGYNALQARAQLLGLMAALRKHPGLLTCYPNVQPEGKKTPTSGAMWDTIKFSPEVRTTAPHLTLVIDRDDVRLQVILPNADKTKGWQRLVRRKREAVEEILELVHGQVRNLRGRPKCFLDLYQRHFLYLGAEGVIDARLEVDLDAVLDKQDAKIDGKVKTRREWWPAVSGLIAAPKTGANLELSLVLRYRYSDSATTSVLNSPDFVEEAAAAFIALHPWYDFLTQEE